MADPDKEKAETAIRAAFRKKRQGRALSKTDPRLLKQGDSSRRSRVLDSLGREELSPLDLLIEREERKREAAREAALRRGNRVEITDPISRLLGREPIVTESPTVGATRRLLSGSNKRIAEVIGVPFEFLNRAIQTATKDKEAKLITTEDIKKAFRQLGFINEEASLNTFEERLGKDITDGALAALAVGLASGPLAAAKGSSITSNLLREFGETIIRRPAAAALGEVGGFAGAGTAGRAAGDNPNLKVLAETAGGLAGATAFTGLPSAVRAGGRIARSAAEAVFPGAAPVRNFGQPLLREASGEDLASSASAVFEKETDEIAKDIATALNKIGPEVPLAKTNLALDDALQQAKARAEKRIKETFRPVDDNISVSPDNLRDEVKALRREVKEGRLIPDNVPEDFIKKNISRFIKKKRPKPLLTEGAGDIRTKIGNLIAQIKSKGGDAKLEKALTRISNAVDADIEAALPADQRAAQLAGRDLVRRFEDLFSRTLVRELLEESRRTGRKLNPKQIVQVIFNRAKREGAFPGFEPAQAIFREFGPQEGEQLLEQGIRVVFRKAAKKNPKRAEELFEQAQPAIETFAPAVTDIGNGLRTLNSLTEARKALEKSIIGALQLRDSDPDRLISRILFGPKPQAEFRELASELSQVEGGLDALKGTVIDALLRRESTPARVLKRMADPTFLRGMREVFTPDELTRFLNINRALAGAGQQGGRKGVEQVSTIIAGISGASVGRAIKTGTIQGPGLVAAAFRNAVKNLFLEEVDESALIRLATLNPEFESLLTSRFPQGAQGARRLAARFNRFVATQQAGITAFEESQKAPAPAPAPEQRRKEAEPARTADPLQQLIERQRAREQQQGAQPQ